MVRIDNTWYERTFESDALEAGRGPRVRRRPAYLWDQLSDAEFYEEPGDFEAAARQPREREGKRKRKGKGKGTQKRGAEECVPEDGDSDGGVAPRSNAELEGFADHFVSLSSPVFNVECVGAAVDDDDDPKMLDALPVQASPGVDASPVQASPSVDTSPVEGSPEDGKYKGGKHGHAKRWEPEEQQLLAALLDDPKFRVREGSDDISWKKISKEMYERGRFVRAPDVCRNRRDRRTRGQKQQAANSSGQRCGVCRQARAGHICTGPPSGPADLRQKAKLQCASPRPPPTTNALAEAPAVAPEPTPEEAPAFAEPLRRRQRRREDEEEAMEVDDVQYGQGYEYGDAATAATPAPAPALAPAPTLAPADPHREWIAHLEARLEGVALEMYPPPTFCKTLIERIGYYYLSKFNREPDWLLGADALLWELEDAFGGV